MPPSLAAPARIRAAWAIARLRHPPLAAAVRMPPGEYTAARFVYAPPRSPCAALRAAEAALEFTAEGKDAMIDRYFNGPRMLGPECLARLVVGCAAAGAREEGLPTPAGTPRLEHGVEEEEPVNVDFMLCTTHFVGDGMALHRFMNEFFVLIAGPVAAAEGTERPRTATEIETLLSQEWEVLWGKKKSAEAAAEVYPAAVEDMLPPVSGGRLRAAAAEVDFQNTQRKVIVRAASSQSFFITASITK